MKSTKPNLRLWNELKRLIDQSDAEQLRAFLDGLSPVAVSMRELSLGLLRPSEMLRVWLKEISIGWINGFALGTLVALLAWLWQGNAVLGLVVGGAMMLNTVIAVSIPLSPPARSSPP